MLASWSLGRRLRQVAVRGSRALTYVWNPSAVVYRPMHKGDAQEVVKLTRLLDPKETNVDDLDRVISHVSDFSMVAATNGGEIIGYCGRMRPDMGSECLHSLVVREDWRGRGVGRELWKQAMEDSSLIQWTHMPFCNEMRIQQCGSSFHFSPQIYHRFYSLRLKFKNEILQTIPYLTPDVYTVTTRWWELAESLYAYDTAVRGNCPRFINFFNDIILGGDDVTVAVALDRHHDIIGYGVSRGHKTPKEFVRLGPLYAENFSVFSSIFYHLVERLAEDAEVHLGLSLDNFDVMRRLSRFPVTGSQRCSCLLWPVTGGWREPMRWHVHKVFFISSDQCFDII